MATNFLNSLNLITKYIQESLSKRTQLKSYQTTFRSTYEKFTQLEKKYQRSKDPEFGWENYEEEEYYLKLASVSFQNDEIEAGEDYLQEAASYGSAEALFQLGCKYQELDDINKAKEHFNAAASKGHEGALCNLGYIYDQEGIYPKAEALYLLAFQKGDADAGINLGLLYYKNKDFTKAEKILKPFAQKGFPKALLCLEDIYRKTKNLDEAKYYLNQVAKHDSEAIYTLGLIYLDDDNDKALEYFHAAANKNNKSAQRMLGILHFEWGHVKAAKHYYTLAIQQNEPTALYNLAAIEMEERNYAEAKRLYKLAADQDFPGAKARLGWVESVESFRITPVETLPVEEKLYEQKDINKHIKIIQNEIQDSQENSIFSEPAIPLCASFNEKDIVKKLGAKWCPKAKTWFIPINFEKKPFDEFLPMIYQENVPSFFPVMVPQNLWSKNLRTFLPKGSWDELRHACYKSSNYRCIVCGQNGNLHCDEVWRYEITDQENGVVHFERLSSLCISCHRVKHFGKAEADDLAIEAFSRLLFINKLTIEEGKHIIENAYQRWEELSQISWKFDLTKLEDDYNVYTMITDFSTGEVIWDSADKKSRLAT